MYTKEQLEGKLERIHEIDSEISALRREKDNIIASIQQHNIEVNIEKVTKWVGEPLKRGDKIVVTTEPFYWESEKNPKDSEPLFFEEMHIPHFSGIGESDIQISCFQIKKDGSPSKRRENFNMYKVVGVKKLN